MLHAAVSAYEARVTRLFAFTTFHFSERRCAALPPSTCTASGKPHRPANHHTTTPAHADAPNAPLNGLMTMNATLGAAAKAPVRVRARKHMANIITCIHRSITLHSRMRPYHHASNAQLTTNRMRTTDGTHI